MRIGSNPEKDKDIKSKGYHRIVIPVYVPNLEGYFEKGLEFTRLCIDSVVKTRHTQSVLTVVNNGSCPEVTQYLQNQFEQGHIDQLVHHASNQGKIDAVMPIAKACSEPLVTISDGDVLFKDGWMHGVEEVFQHFPEAGMVSPVPHGTTYAAFTTNTLFDAFFKRKLKFQSLCDPQDMLRFAESIGSETMYEKKIRLKYQLTVRRRDFSAVVGCGHFVSTLRKEVFDQTPKELSSKAYASKADRDYIDIPLEKAGLWRLATAKNLAYHIGNSPQPWMNDEFQKLQGHETKMIEIPKLRKWDLDLGFKKFVNRLWMNKYTKPFFFKRMGLREGWNEY